MQQSSAKKEAARVTLVGMWLDLLLGTIKILGGALTGSFALITDGIHSLSDSVSDIFVLVVNHFAHDAPDQEHPYGHGRFETVGTVVMGMFFFAIAAVLLYDSFKRLLEPETLAVPALGGLFIAAISIASKEWIYQYTMRSARRLNSSLLRANAWHSRSDAISSIAVLIGIFGARQGLPWLDVIAAMFVALIIARIGWQLRLDSLKELVDTAIPREHEARIRDTVLDIPGVNRITGLRSRQSGGRILLDLRVQVDPRISVSEGHQLGEICRRSIQDKFSNISEVLVHIDPEYHSDSRVTDLPLRQEIEARIATLWQDLIDDFDSSNIELHYLGNGIEINLYLAHRQIDESQARILAQALTAIPAIKRLKIYSTVMETHVADIE